MLGIGLLALAPRPAAAELVPKSRNSVVFVESVREGEEWEAFRVVDDGHPAQFTVTAPGRVLLRLRTLGRPEPVDAVAAVLLDDQVVLTARVESAVDDLAELADGGGRPSGVRLFLLKVDQAPARFTVRFSEGPPILVSARFAPPLREAEVAGAEVPLVAPAPPAASVPTVGSLRPGGGTLAAEPAEPPPAAPDAEVEPTPEPEGLLAEALPEGDAGDEPEPPALWEHPGEDQGLELESGIMAAQASLLLEGRAGLHLDGLAPGPGATAGADLRVALLGGAAARDLTLGVGLDVGYTQGEARVSQAGAPVGVARFRHTFFALTADARVRLWTVGEAAELYASLGGGVLLGRAGLSGYRGDSSAGTQGFLGSGALGVTLGVAGHRPFLEVRGWAGTIASPVVRPGADAPAGDAAGYVAAAALVGYRFEFLGGAAPPDRARD
jgi:hypothetical protein